MAARVLALHRLVSAEKGPSSPRNRAKADLESHAADKIGASTAEKQKGKEIKEKFDKKEALPVKEENPDQALYSSFPEKSLRRRLWDAVVAGKCTRCSGPYLRVTCPKPRHNWEDDF